MSSKKKFKAVVVGLGNIGFGLDFSKKGCVFTHTKACLKNKDVDLVAGVDKDEKKRVLFSRITKRPSFDSLEKVRQAVDIVFIATPTETHCQMTKSALRMNPKLIVLEKPLSKKIGESREILKMAKGTALFVNYMRRCDPFLKKVKENIQTRNWGEFLFGFIYYNRGLYNNGSHSLDLLDFWFEQKPRIEYVSKLRRIHEPADFNIDFLLDYKGKKCFFKALEAPLSEYDLVFTEARIRYLDSDMSYEVYRKSPHPCFKGFAKMELQEKKKIKSFLFYQENVLNHLVNYLKGKTKLACDGKTALSVLKTIERIKNYEDRNYKP